MSVNRRAAKRDGNEREIIEALRAAGASVQALSIRGCADLLVGIDGGNYLLEIKVAKGKLTPDEIDWHTSWNGQVTIVRSVEDALAAIGR